MRKTTATPFSRMACANLANSMQVFTTRECASIVFRIFGAEWIGLNMANDKLINYNSCENAALTRIHIRKRSTTAALMGHKSSISSKFKIVISFRLHSRCAKHTAHGETYASFVSNFQRLVAPSLDCHQSPCVFLLSFDCCSTLIRRTKIWYFFHFDFHFYLFCFHFLMTDFSVYFMNLWAWNQINYCICCAAHDFVLRFFAKKNGNRVDCDGDGE